MTRYNGWSNSSGSAGGDILANRAFNNSSIRLTEPENVSTSASYGGYNGELSLFNPLSTASYKSFYSPRSR